MPKPVRCASPVDSLIRMLAGFRSLWTSPRWWSPPRVRPHQRSAMARRRKRPEAPSARREGSSSGTPPGSSSTSVALLAFALEPERLRGPGCIELIFQCVLVRQAIGRRRRCVAGHRNHDQHRASVAVPARAPAAVEDALAVLPQHLRAWRPDTSQVWRMHHCVFGVRRGWKGRDSHRRVVRPAAVNWGFRRKASGQVPNDAVKPKERLPLGRRAGWPSLSAPVQLIGVKIRE